jgi:PAS domain S-box-containing protein
MVPDLSADPTAGLMPGVDVDMAGIDLGLSPVDADGQTPSAQAYSPFIAHSQQLRPALPSNASSDAFARPQDGVLTGAGAGPLPTGFGAQNMNPTGSTLTEFTKRRNWSQRVLEEVRDFLHILTPDGRILYVSPSCKTLTGWDVGQLVSRFVTDFIHPDDRSIFVKEFNESIASGNALRFFYRFRKSDDSWMIFESHGHPHLTNDVGYMPQNSLSCRGFFMMSRPYPTKNAALLDSFLEHKIENEKLTKRIAELKREELEEQTAQERDWANEGQSSVTASDALVNRTDSMSQASASYRAMPPPAKPSVSNTALTRQNLDEALAASKPDSINDKMMRYEGATHLETIEMLTGLRYRDGERSQGISTGDASPLLIRGDAGIQIPVDRDGRSSGDRKKKLKIADEYVCTDCGTLDSPEWRKGPNGPKTLCNACGCESYMIRCLPASLTDSRQCVGQRKRRKDRAKVSRWLRFRHRSSSNLVKAVADIKQQPRMPVIVTCASESDGMLWSQKAYTVDAIHHHSQLA